MNYWVNGRMKKINAGILFGGRSGEHEVSLNSARSVINVMDPEKYNLTLIGISHSGAWFTGPNVLDDLQAGRLDGLTPVTFLTRAGEHILYALETAPGGRQALVPLADLDVIFPVLHGTYGEDGTLQGMLEMLDIAYVGAGVLGSAVGMDKGLFKDLLRANGIPMLETLTVNRFEIANDLPGIVAATEKLGAYPLFVKPANLGSSVGITRCRGRSELVEGIQEAACFDRRVVIERGLVNPLEVEVSVLGNEDPQASIPGQIRPSDEFYTYNAKYIDGLSELIIPARLPAETTARVRELAVRAFRIADCAGMARADFLVTPDTFQVYLNEINTIPGFTQISMYPKLWEASGLPYPALIDRLIELAFERKAQKDQTIREYRRAS